MFADVNGRMNLRHYVEGPHFILDYTGNRIDSYNQISPVGFYFEGVPSLFIHNADTYLIAFISM